MDHIILTRTFSYTNLLKSLKSMNIKKLTYNNNDIFYMLRCKNIYCIKMMNIMIELFDTNVINIDVIYDNRIYLTFDFGNKILILINNIDFEKNELDCSVVFYIDTTQINNISKYIYINMITSNFIFDSHNIVLNFFEHHITFVHSNFKKNAIQPNIQVHKLYAQPTCLH